MRDERTRALADELKRRGLAAPALVLLEAHRPLRPLLSSLGTFLSPISRSFAARTAGSVEVALADDEAYEALLDDLADAEGGTWT
ncbi:MAG TPA: hypothetical protein VH987_00095 [Candidatus Limnocylindria bacterium]|jgi:hypothetical protein